MNPRRRCFQQIALVASLAGCVTLASTVLGQSTNRQVGTQFTVTADPLVQRPDEQPCIVPLFANYQFAHFSDTAQTFELTPPGNCAGPWEKIVFEVDLREKGGW